MSLKRRMKRAAEKQYDAGDLAFVNGYEITCSPTRDDWYSRLPSAAKAAIVRPHAAITAEGVDQETVRELEGLVAAHPRAPVFYNYLTVAYSRAGMTERADQTTDEMLSRFPEYLFGRMNRAEKAVREGDAEAVLSLLGPGLELRKLYPGRRRYHVSEFASYHSVVGRFELMRGNRSNAEALMVLLDQVAPDDNATFALARELEKPIQRDRATHFARMLAAPAPQDEPPERP